MTESISFEKLSDLEILAEACKGERSHFEALLHRYYHLIYRFAFRLRGDRDEALEVTHGTLARIAKTIRAFRSTARFRSWLYRLISKVEVDLRSRWKKERKGERRKRDYATEHEDNRVALSALDSLGRLERRAVVLMVYEGLSAKHVAQVLGCAESSVNWRMFKARRRLISQISKLEPECALESWPKIAERLRRLEPPPMPGQEVIDGAVRAAGDVFESGPREIERLPPAGWMELLVDLVPTIAAALLLVVLWHEFAPRHEVGHGLRARQLARYSKILSEASLAFPTDLAGVILKGKELEIETNPSAGAPSSAGVLVEIGKRGEKVRLLTYSGRRVPLTISDERIDIEVLETGSGAIMILGPDFAWQSDSRSNPRGLRIEATSLDALSQSR